MTLDQARADYKLLAAALRSERSKRDRFLAEPRRSEAIKEMDDALAALQRMGQIVAAAAAAGLVETVYEQAPLLDLPKQTTY